MTDLTFEHLLLMCYTHSAVVRREYTQEVICFEKIVNYTEKLGRNVVDSHDLNYFCSAEHMYRRIVVKETYVTDVLLL